MSINGNLPGMLNTAINGFNRTWSTVESHRDRKGNVVSWSFTCGCGEERYYKVKRHGFDGAYSLARDCVEGHRCPSKKQSMRDGMRRVAKAV